MHAVALCPGPRMERQQVPPACAGIQGRWGADSRVRTQACCFHDGGLRAPSPQGTLCLAQARLPCQMCEPTVSPDTGRQSARHGASRHAPPTAGAVPSSPARPARPQRKNDEICIVEVLGARLRMLGECFTNERQPGQVVRPGRGPTTQ